MAITLECVGCKSSFTVSDKYAGKTGSCKRCGSSVSIPGPNFDDAPPMQRLADASPEDMIRELERRKLQAVLAILHGESDNLMAGGDLLESNDRFDSALRLYGQDAMEPRKLARMFQHLSEKSQEKSQATSIVAEDDEDDVFALKGDRLGMTLAQFKTKYARKISGHNKPLPWCSDEMPGKPIPELLAEPWHSAVGIVHGRIDFPFENNSPTVAGVDTHLLLYQFIDGKLFQISAFFNPEGFHGVSQGLTSKFGTPVKEQQTPRQLGWWSMASSIELTAGSIRPRQYASLCYYHDRLRRLATERKPDRSADL